MGQTEDEGKEWFESCAIQTVTSAPECVAIVRLWW
jgi:hypothetical protein